MLSIDDILSANDTEVREIQCPEWGGSVYVRTLSAADRDTLQHHYSDNPAGVRAMIAATAMCDSEGNQLPITQAQVNALAKKASAPIERIVDAVSEMNGLHQEYVDGTKKNSVTTDESN